MNEREALISWPVLPLWCSLWLTGTRSAWVVCLILKQSMLFIWSWSTATSALRLHHERITGRRRKDVLRLWAPVWCHYFGISERASVWSLEASPAAHEKQWKWTNCHHTDRLISEGQDHFTVWLWAVVILVVVTVMTAEAEASSEMFPVKLLWALIGAFRWSWWRVSWFLTFCDWSERKV